MRFTETHLKVAETNGGLALEPKPDSGLGSVAADRELVDRCLLGVTSAWEEIYKQCHPALFSCIRHALSRLGLQLDLADEISARVWHALVTNNGRQLARFDPNRGCRLTTYVGGFAHKEILRHMRTERRQRARVLDVGQAALARSLGRASPWGMEAEISDFLATLTPREREFCEEHILSFADCNQIPKFSESNMWQLRHRIRRKLEQFIGRES